MIISETTVNKSRVILMDPPILKSGTPVLVGLHGLGTNAEDFVGLVEEMDLPDVRFVLVDAPMLMPGGGGEAHQWYDFERHDRQEIIKSREHIFKVLDRFANDPNVRSLDEKPKQETPLVLFGFSQGGVMTLEAGLNYKGKLSAIVSMSGYMPDPYETISRAEAPFEIPILLVHGQYDGVVPIEGSRQAERELKSAGYSPVLKEFPMDHTISRESLDAVKEFLKKALKI